jgi:hypothetical protein
MSSETQTKEHTMAITSKLPISQFVLKPFAEHPAGTLLILPRWRRTPEKLCLALKLSGFVVDGKEVQSVLILQGRMHQQEDSAIGEIVYDVSNGLEVFTGDFLGLHCPTRVEINRDTLADFSGDRSWRNAPGSLALGSFGVRVCGISRASYHGWGYPIDPGGWIIDRGDPSAASYAIVDSWVLAFEVDVAHEFQLPIQTRPGS